jgi:hypothetical protein
MRNTASDVPRILAWFYAGHAGPYHDLYPLDCCFSPLHTFSLFLRSIVEGDLVEVQR